MKVSEWTRKAEIRNAEFLAVGETCKAIYWPTTGFDEKTVDSSWLFSRGGLNFWVCSTWLRQPADWLKKNKKTLPYCPWMDTTGEKKAKCNTPVNGQSASTWSYEGRGHGDFSQEILRWLNQRREVTALDTRQANNKGHNNRDLNRLQ